MSTTALQILAEIATTGWSCILLHKAREAKAAEDLRQNGIIYIDAGNPQMWIVKFGRAPFGHLPREM